MVGQDFDLSRGRIRQIEDKAGETRTMILTASLRRCGTLYRLGEDGWLVGRNGRKQEIS